MFNHRPSTHREALAQFYAQYDAGVQSGEYAPFVYPWGTLGAFVVLLYLLIPRHDSPTLKRLRFFAFAFNAIYAIHCIMHTKARFVACGFGIGLIQAWAMLWTAAIMIFNDGVVDFKRIERTAGTWGTSKHQEEQNGFANGHTVEPSADKSTRAESTAGPAQRRGHFMWQGYPLSPFVERVDWVADVFCNFRGMGWNWRISGIQPPPKWVQEQLQETSGAAAPSRLTRKPPRGVPRYETRSELLRKSVRNLIIGYLVLDLLKVIIIHDPFLWGLEDSGAPTWLPGIVRTSPVLTRTYRLLFCQAGVYWALKTIFQLGPIFFCGILGPKMIGARGEPWMYPDAYGSYRHVLDKGLTGWWGGWWHQSFRFAFEQPSKWLVERFGMDRRSLSAKALQLLVAFALSGTLHACGSYTMLPYTRPLRGPFLFFALQAFGIMAQTEACRWFQKRGFTQRIPKLVRQLGNFVFVHVWFYYTAPLLADDFARGGIWLLEPVPISPLRALGFGVEGDGWWCWGGRWLSWHHGDRWWQSGLAL